MLTFLYQCPSRTMWECAIAISLMITICSWFFETGLKCPNSCPPLKVGTVWSLPRCHSATVSLCVFIAASEIKQLFDWGSLSLCCSFYSSAGSTEEWSWRCYSPSFRLLPGQEKLLTVSGFYQGKKTEGTWLQPFTLTALKCFYQFLEFLQTHSLWESFSSFISYSYHSIS